MRIIPGLVALLLVLAPPIAEAKGGSSRSGSGHSSHSSTPSHSPSSPHSPHKAQGVARDSNGKIARSSSAKSDFKRSHPCPSTGKSGGSCPGYVIDHVRPLKRGGADAPGNMQWQTTQAAKAKDKWE